MTESSTRKVAIVGSAENWPSAPFDDSSWEIWTLNDMHIKIPRMDRIFLLDYPDEFEQIPQYKEWYGGNDTIPVYMHHTLPWIPQAAEYPTDAILKEYGDYFTNSVSWMIALALYEGVDEIGVWGVNMAHGTEYAQQRPSCEYMIGVARGRGTPVYVPKSSTLLASGFRYGVEKSGIYEDCRVRMESLHTQMTAFQNTKLESMLNEAKITGALEMLAYFQATYGG